MLFTTPRSRACALALLAGLTAHADASVLFVRADLNTGAGDGSSWTNAYKGRLGLAEALAAAQPGDQIWVAAGQYAPAAANASRMISFQLKNGVEILGGFSGVETQASQRDPFINFTTLTGDLNDDDGWEWEPGCDNSAHVVRSVGNDATAILDGFVITAGNAVDCGSINQVDREDGAGMLIEGGSPTITTCFFSTSVAGSAGGGLCIDAAFPTITACEFDRNTAYQYGAGAASIRGSHSTFTNCVFIENGGSQGAALFHGRRFQDQGDAGSITVTDSRFQANEGRIGAANGGGLCAFGGLITVQRCLFDGNAANGGGALFLMDAASDVRDCLITGNAANGDLGDAVTVSGGSARLSNCAVIGHIRRAGQFADASPFILTGNLEIDHCTLARNGGTDTNGNFGAGVFVVQPGGSLTIRNSIAWGNRCFTGTGFDAVILLIGNGTASMDSSCAQGWNGSIPGLHNFAADPLFADADGLDNFIGTADDNVRLLNASPCIDRADNALTPADLVHDLDGIDRFIADPIIADLGFPGAAGGCAIADLGSYEHIPAGYCPADADCSGFVDTDDYDTFVLAFEAGEPSADFDLSGFVDTDDFDAFVQSFEAGC